MLGDARSIEAIHDVGPILGDFLDQDGAKVGDEDIVPRVKVGQNRFKATAEDFAGGQKGDWDDRVGVDGRCDGSLIVVRLRLNRRVRLDRVVPVCEDE